MDGFIYFLMAVLSMFTLFMVRVTLIFNIRQKELKLVSARARKLIDEDKPWEQEYAYYDSGPSHNFMIIDLRKWTHRQFYGTK